jgi:hypothetical protein
VIAVGSAAVALAATVSALAVSRQGNPRASTVPLATTTTSARGAVPGGTTSTTAPATTSTTLGPATTATTIVTHADSLLYINGVNQTASDVSSVIIASCVAGTPSSIEVTVRSLISKTPTGSIEWRLNQGPEQFFPLTQGSVTISYLCPAAVPPSGSVQVAISYAGDSTFFASAVIAQLGVLPG